MARLGKRVELATEATDSAWSARPDDHELTHRAVQIAHNEHSEGYEGQHVKKAYNRES